LLSKLIKYDSRTIREHLKDSVLLEGIHYIRPFGGRNQRCREQTELKDTPANRKKLEKVLERIQAEIILGSFNYATIFPNSRLVKKFSEPERKASIASGENLAPSFEVYADDFGRSGG